ncbi:MAG: hypothetical protein IPP07_14090 [Holophagales bacterium]|nr:hypothetical protein [Holophagales bacterium]
MKELRVVLVLALALAGSSVRAADYPEGAKNRFQFELGGGWDSFDTEASLSATQDGIASAEATIDLELLDIPVPPQHVRLVGQWRFSNVSYDQVSYSEKICCTRRRTVDESIVWDDATYAAGGQIDGTFDSEELHRFSATTRSRDPGSSSSRRSAAPGGVPSASGAGRSPGASRPSLRGARS